MLQATFNCICMLVTYNDTVSPLKSIPQWGLWIFIIPSFGFQVQKGVKLGVKK